MGLEGVANRLPVLEPRPWETLDARILAAVEL